MSSAYIDFALQLIKKMGSCFSSAEKNVQQNRITDIDRAILDLKIARDKLNIYKKKLNMDSEKLLVRAKGLKDSGDTEAALYLLRLRRQKLNQLENLDGQLYNLEQLVLTIQTKEQEVSVIDALTAGKDALKKMNEENSVEDVLKLMEDIQEQHDITSEITTLLGQGANAMTDDEMAEFEEELQGLENKVENSALQPDFPVAPKTKLPKIDVDTGKQTVKASSVMIAS
jgi:hypothetical protein